MQRDSGIKQRVPTSDRKHLLCGLADDVRSRIASSVDPMAEAADDFLLPLHLLDVFEHVVGRADVDQHADDGLIGSAM